MTQTPAGWYPQGNEERYWDGAQWTEQRRPLSAPQYAPPPKKKHTLRNVLLVLIGLGVLFIGGCVAIVGLAANEVSKEIDKAEKADAEPGGPDNPMEIAPGEAFSVRDFDYEAGWTLTGGDFGGIEIEGLKVTNNRDRKDSAIIEIKLWRGNEVLALADCTTEPITPGTKVTLACFSGDDMPNRYDRVTINDTF